MRNYHVRYVIEQIQDPTPENGEPISTTVNNYSKCERGRVGRRQMFRVLTTKPYKHPRAVLNSIAHPCVRQITLSAVEGARDPALDNRTLPEYFTKEVLAQRPARPALICRQERPRAHGGPLPRNMGVERHLAWDFSEFDSHIGALARGLVGLGVKQGDRVGVVMGNNRYSCLGCYSDDLLTLSFPYSAYAMLQWACASIGAILVTVNPAYRIHELVRYFEVSTRLGVLTFFFRRLRLSALLVSVIFSSSHRSALPPT